MAETQGSQRERGRAAGDGNDCDRQHPAWCSPEHCLVTDDGVRFHGQAPVRWEDHEAGVRFESQLFDPADDEDTYVELVLENLRLKWTYLGILPVEVVRRLRDQLTEHLDAAGCGREHFLCQECVSEANVWGAAADRQATR